VAGGSEEVQVFLPDRRPESKASFVSGVRDVLSRPIVVAGWRLTGRRGG